MAGSSLLALLDDIATVLDDVAVMTKLAAKRTAGVLGDDLALNAQQVAGVRADRELPVVWAVAKGSAKNKLILVPAAIALSAFLPWLIMPLLMLGGAFLCYEGFEKVAHALFVDEVHKQAEHTELTNAVADESLDMVAFEQNKIKGAIRTDFILSAEIIVISLGTVKDASIMMQTAVVCGIAAIMTIGVYALVAGIVKLDDAGLALVKQTTDNLWSRFKQRVGYSLLWFAPRLMKTLSVVGTIAMFMVGGGILVHGLPNSHDLLHLFAESLQTITYAGPVLSFISGPLINVIAGLVVGSLGLVAMMLVSKLKPSVSQE
ncbi:DUF808 domain-containing protein [Pseudomonadota bacterium]